MDNQDNTQEDYYDKIAQGICPVCEQELLDSNGCVLCYSCGWSACEA